MDHTSYIARSQSGVPLPSAMPAVKYAQYPSVAGIGGLGVTTAPVDPTSLTQRLPSIVNPVAASPTATCDPFTAWVSENPMLAIGGLAVAAYFMIFHKGKK